MALDLGVSSTQLDTAERGFSFRLDGPLDMRMGETGERAADLVGRLAEDELEQLIRSFGEERFARRVARARCETCRPACRCRSYPSHRPTTRSSPVGRSWNPSRR